MTDESIEQVCALLDEFNKKIAVPYFAGDPIRALIVLLDGALLEEELFKRNIAPGGLFSVK